MKALPKTNQGMMVDDSHVTPMMVDDSHVIPMMSSFIRRAWSEDFLPLIANPDGLRVLQRNSKLIPFMEKPTDVNLGTAANPIQITKANWGVEMAKLQMVESLQGRVTDG